MAGTVAFDTIEDGGGEQQSVDRLIHGICYAWVNFNGTGTIAIRDSYNVTSLTDDGTGTYQVNLTTAIPNVNAAVVAGAQAGTTSASGNRTAMPAMIDTSTIRITCYSLASPAFTDGEYMQCAVFSNLV